MNETTDKDLRILCRKYNIPLNGIYIADRLEKIRDGNTIINLNGNSHWTCIVKDKDKCVYFDSFGVVPPKHLQRLMGDYTYNDKELQALNSSSCGFYVIAFLKFMRQKSNEGLLDTFKSLFTDGSYLHNEVILKCFLNKE